MKKIISIAIIFTIFLSTLGGFTVSSEEKVPSFESGFEFDFSQAGWGIYTLSDTNDYTVEIRNDKEFTTEGDRSLYIYNKTAAYVGADSPYYSVEEYGEYTLTADVRVLTGQLRVCIRCYLPDRKTYVQKHISINKNENFETCTFTHVIKPDTPYVRFFLLASNGEGEHEGYIDNVKLVKTRELDEESYKLQKQIQTSLDSAAPGTVITLPDGEYSDVTLNVKNSGESGNPIIIKAKNPGKVILKEASSITVLGDYVRLEGLRFEEVTSSQIVHFTIDSNHSSLVDCAFYNCDPVGADTLQQNWVMLRGQSLTVSGCFFSGKSSYAQMVESSKHETNKGIPDNHLIENCYFGDFKDANGGNGYEVIRLGTSPFPFENAKTTVQGCFFYKCNGEGETISVKSCEVTVKNNTLYDNNGAIVLRHADRSDVYGNLFIGGKNNTRTATGIRLNGEGHRIHDNYFYNLANNSAALHIYHGCPQETVQPSHYYKVKDLKAYNNTFIGSDRVMVVGEYSPNSNNVASNRILGPEGEIYNNAIVSYSGTRPLITNGDPAPGKTNDENAYHKVKFTNNYAYGKDLGYKENGVSVVPNGVNNEYFRLVQNGKYFEPENGTGADIEIVKNAPTSPFDVISDWVKEVYYDTGKVTFEVVENDPFNNLAAHINNIIPFNISVTTDSNEDSIKLYENNTQVSGNSKTVSNNPTMKVVAEIPRNKEVTWFVNGKLLNESNIDTLGIVANDVHSNELIINNITENFNIEAEINEIQIVPDKIVGEFSKIYGISDKENPLVVKNHNDKYEEVTGKYVLLAKKIPVSLKYRIKEWGVMISDGDDYIYKVMPSKVSLTSDGAFGMVLYNLKDEKSYQIKPYAVYLDENDMEKVVVGTAENITD